MSGADKGGIIKNKVYVERTIIWLIKIYLPLVFDIQLKKKKKKNNYQKKKKKTTKKQKKTKMDVRLMINHNSGCLNSTVY